MQEAMLAGGARRYVYPDSGPGPIVSVGDRDVSFFGEVSNAELFTGAELFAQIPGFGGALNNDNYPWLKFHYYGKFLFIKKFPSIYQNAGGKRTDWKQLYELGMIYGEDGNGEYNAGIPTLQIRLVQKGSYRFKVRTITGDETPTSSFPVGNTSDNTARRKSMYTELLYRVVKDAVGPYTEKKFKDYTYGEVFSATELTREVLKNVTYPNGVVTVRGSGVTSSTPPFTGVNIGGFDFNYPFYWRPVLELVTANTLFSLKDPGYSVDGFMRGAPSNVQVVVEFPTDGTSVSRLSDTKIQSANISYLGGISGQVEGLGTANPARLKEIRFQSVNPSYVAGISTTYTP